MYGIARWLTLKLHLLLHQLEINAISLLALAWELTGWYLFPVISGVDGRFENIFSNIIRNVKWRR